jgi:hypothetical protein
MSDVRDPKTDQPLPQPGRTAIHQLVINSLPAWLPGDNLVPERSVIVEGMRARLSLGVAKYGTPLQSHNGRDALQDCWEEVLDSTVYAVQMLLEGEEVGDVVLTLISLLGKLAWLKLERAKPYVQ